MRGVARQHSFIAFNNNQASMDIAITYHPTASGSPVAAILVSTNICNYIKHGF